MADHPRQGQADGRAVRPVVVLAAVEMRVAQDGVAADDIERQRLAGQPGRGRQRDHPAHAVRVAGGPGQRLVPAQRAADDRQQLADAQRVQQPALHLHHVADGDGGKIAAVGLAGGGVDAAGAGGAAATAQQIGADDEEAVGVDRLARADHDVPPAGIVLLVVPGDVRIPAEGVADQDGVVARGVELAVGLVGDGDAGQQPPSSNSSGWSSVADRAYRSGRACLRTLSLLSNGF